MLTAGHFSSAVSLLSWTAKAGVITILTSKQKSCYSEVGRRLGAQLSRHIFRKKQFIMRCRVFVLRIKMNRS